MTAPEIAERLHARRSGPGRWNAKCPGHKDLNPSLSIGEGKDGRILLKCHAGCGTEAILAAMGLTIADLYPPQKSTSARKEGNSEPIFYDYYDATERLNYQVCRSPGKKFWQRRPDGNGGWIRNLDGITRILYRLPEVLRADVVMIAEGEKDADTLAGLHLEMYPEFEGRRVAATTNSGGAGKWDPCYVELLKGKDVLVFEDNDDAGRNHAEIVLASLAACLSNGMSVKRVQLPGLRARGDVSAWMQDHTANDLLAEIDRAPVWHPEPVATPLAVEAEIESSTQSGEVGILEAALEAVGHRDTVRETFCALCVVLQRLRGNEAVLLPVEKIADEIGCHWTLISRLRRQVVAAGGLKPDKPAIAHRRAASFFVLSDTPPFRDVVIENFPLLRIPSHSYFSDTPHSSSLSDTPPIEFDGAVRACTSGMCADETTLTNPTQSVPRKGYEAEDSL